MSRTRRLLVAAHLWLGLVLGGLWAVQGATGAWLVYHRDVAAVVAKPVPIGPRVPLDTVAANVGGDVLRIRIPGPSPDRFEVDLADKRTVTVAAATGTVVPDAVPRLTGANQWLYHLHEELLGGETGKNIVGLSGIVLITAALTGLWIGWPRGGRWREAFAPSRWRTRKIKLYGWHRASGLLVTLALVVVPTSGAMMIWGKELRAAAAAVLPYAAPCRAAPVDRLAAPVVGAEAAWHRARAVFPEANFVRLTYPTPKAPVYTFRLHQPGEWRAWSGTTSVTIDPATGRVLHRYDAAAAPLANRLLDGAFALHNGEIAGPIGRPLIILVGLALPALWVTGVLAWWRKRRRSPALSAPLLAPAE